MKGTARARLNLAVDHTMRGKSYSNNLPAMIKVKPETSGIASLVVGLSASLKMRPPTSIAWKFACVGHLAGLEPNRMDHPAMNAWRPMIGTHPQLYQNTVGPTADPGSQAFREEVRPRRAAVAA